MIYKLQQKFIRICILSFLLVFTVLFIAIISVTAHQTNASLDRLANIVSENGGRFPKHSDSGGNRNNFPEARGMNRETPFSTRFFTVSLDRRNQPVLIDTQAVSSVSREEAVNYAREVLTRQSRRGWIDDFRYNVYEGTDDKIVVFINGADAKQSNQRFLFSTLLVLTVSNVIIILLIIFISRRAVAPIAESYEKQKQFITDANHELKTPLTLIQTNLDILETDIGKNEWLSDIREEAQAMTGLVNQLVTLAHMDEEGQELPRQNFSLSDAVSETVLSFAAYAVKKGKKLETDIPPDITYHGNEQTIRQLVALLIDNAVKYCDAGGLIRVTLSKKKGPVLMVENTFEMAGTIELNRLFDRFYRADKARTFGSGYGVGLSIAKTIVEKHNGKIRAINIENQIIRFQVNL